MFTLSEATNGRPLSVLSFALFAQSGVSKFFSLDETKLARFLLRIEEVRG